MAAVGLVQAPFGLAPKAPLWSVDSATAGEVAVDLYRRALDERDCTLAEESIGLHPPDQC